MIRPQIRALTNRGNVTLEEWKTLRTNSWEHELLVPKLTDEALEYVVNHWVDNCQIDKRRPFNTYNDAVIGLVVPELMRRLKVYRNDKEAKP